MDNTQRITLDIRDNQTYEQFYTKQYNKGFSIEFEITKDGEPFDLSGCTASFEMKKPDKTVIWSSCNMADNILSVAVDDQMTVADGKAEFQITLMQGETLITTVTGTIKIDRSVIQNDDIESSDQFNIITDILVQIGEAKQAAIDAKASADESAEQAILAKSYAVGGTGRDGEDTDNAKYYKEQANILVSTIRDEVNDTLDRELAKKADLDTNGQVKLEQIPKVALDNLVKVENDTARFALTTDTVQTGDTIKVLESDDGSGERMYLVVDDTKLNSEDGYTPYSAVVATTATTTSYNNTDSGLISENVQDAIDEVCESYQTKNIEVSTNKLREWTAGGNAGSDVFYGITYGNNMFVAVGFNGTIYYSIDGINWNSAICTDNDGISGTLYGVAYGNGLFVAVNLGGSTYYSTDGINWSVGNSVGTGTYSMRSITYGNNMFIIVGDSGSTYYSTDGINWSVGTGIVGKNLKDVTYGNNMFVAVGYSSASGNSDDTIYYSEDGINWNIGSGANDLSYVTYGNNMFVAVGQIQSSNKIIYYSTDGINWTVGCIINTNLSLNAITYGNNMFVAVSSGGYTYYSIDGIRWNNGKIAGGGILKVVAYGNGIFITIDSDGNSYYTTIIKEPQNLEDTINTITTDINIIMAKFEEYAKLSVLASHPIGSIYMTVDSTNPSTLPYFEGTVWEEWGSGRVPVGVDTSSDDFNEVEKTGGASTITLTETQIPSHSHGLNSHTHTISHTHTYSHTHGTPATTITSSGNHTHTTTAKSASNIMNIDGTALKWQSSARATGGNATLTGDGTTNVTFSIPALSIASSGAHTHTVPAMTTNSQSATTTSAASATNSGAATGNTATTGGGEAHSNLQPYITCFMWKRIA